MLRKSWIACYCALIALSMVACAAGEEPTAPSVAVYWNGIDAGTGSNNDPPATCGSPGAELNSSGVGGQARLAQECAYDFKVTCQPSTLTWGQTTHCEFDKGSSGVVQLLGWEFRGANNQFVEHPFGVMWSGPMLESGNVVAKVLAGSGNQVRYTVPVALTVRPRAGGMSWAGSIGGRMGQPGELDHCFRAWSTLEAGLVAGQSCASGSTALMSALFTPATYLGDSRWVTTSQPIAFGPNKGLAVVVASSATMQLRAQVRKLFRSDGDTISDPIGSLAEQACGSIASRNIYSVNNTCVPNAQFSAFVSAVWQHEGYHLSVAMQEAASPLGDLHAGLFALPPLEIGTLRIAAEQVFDFAHGHVSLIAKGTHTSHAQPATFSFIWHNGSAWVNLPLSTF